MEAADEARLASLAAEGDRDAFARLVTPHAKILAGYIAKRVGISADADDILQDTMLSAWKSVANFDGRSSFRTWVVSLAKRRVADFYRKTGRSETVPLSENEWAYAKDIINESENRMDVKSALAHLNGDDNELVYLIFTARLSYNEISEAIGIPAGTIKSRMAAIKMKLKKMLEGSGK